VFFSKCAKTVPKEKTCNSYLSQRKDSSIWYVALRDPVSGNVGTKKSTGTSVRREAETIAQLWLRDGRPRTSKESYETFVDFLDHFWDFENSMHFKDLLEWMSSYISSEYGYLKKAVSIFRVAHETFPDCFF
jgi:hypothetical protein